MNHIERMCLLMLSMGCIVGLAYGTEFFMAAYSGNGYEQFVFKNRAFGPMAWAYWTMVTCNVCVPQLLWIRKVRTCLPVVFVIVILVNVGMWFERFVIIVTSLYRDFLPSSWAHYTPSLVEIATFVGSFGLFFTCFLLFCRIAPAIAIAEIKGAAHLKKRPTRVSVVEGECSMSHRVLFAAFEHEDDLLAATAAVRQKGLRIVDAFTPYAVHGLDRAMGLKPSRLTWVCFVCGMTRRIGNAVVRALGRVRCMGRSTSVASPGIRCRPMSRSRSKRPCCWPDSDRCSPCLRSAVCILENRLRAFIREPRMTICTGD